jgi:lysophospholipase L1-like esterase
VTSGQPSFLALGDSYSIGEGVAERDRWPTQLAMSIRRDGEAIEDPRYIAVTGWTTDELWAGIDAVEAGESPLSPPYRLVTLQIGVNDQYRGRLVAEFAPSFTRLLERAIGFAGGDASHVLVLSIPDWGRTPFARAQGRDPGQVSRELDAYNSASAEICAAHGVPWIDITDLTRTPAGGNEVVDDGLHPSPSMYALWVERIFGAD